MADRHAAATDGSNPGGAPPVAVVAIGLSGCGLPALDAFLAALPEAADAAFVVVSDAAEPLDMTEAALRLHRHRPVRADGEERLAAGQLSLVPTGAAATVRDGVLRLAPPDRDAAHRGTIDTLLLSVAEDAGAGAVGVLLGTRRDTGRVGLARIRERGGLALAEGDAFAGPDAGHDPADPPDRARSGSADLVGDPAALAARLGVHLAFRLAAVEAAEGGEGDGAPVAGEERLPAIADVLRQRTGHNFHGYRPDAFLRRVRRRMAVAGLPDLDAYVARLGAEADEAGLLFQDLLIGTTRFFRDEAALARLGRDVLPALLRAKDGPGDALRVWVLGCATGEEAYSVAILIGEAAAALDRMPNVQIFATDIDARALSVARAGRYPRAIEDHVSPARLRRWFVTQGETYSVRRELREMCIFSAHDIVRDAPFSRIDVMSCRNLLVYLRRDLQDRVIPLFHFALRRNGCLFLGPAENVTRHASLFEPIDEVHRIYRRVETAARASPPFPPSAGSAARGAFGGAPSAFQLARQALMRQAERVAERYAPAYVVLDGSHDIVHFSGRTGPFLDPSSGAASLSIHQLVHRELRSGLRDALERVAATGDTVRLAPIEVGSRARRGGPRSRSSRSPRPRRTA